MRLATLFEFFFTVGHFFWRPKLFFCVYLRRSLAETSPLHLLSMAKLSRMAAAARKRHCTRRGEIDPEEAAELKQDGTYDL
jgi:hypothetical protein